MPGKRRASRPSKENMAPVFCAEYFEMHQDKAAQSKRHHDCANAGGGGGGGTLGPQPRAPGTDRVGWSRAAEGSESQVKSNQGKTQERHEEQESAALG